MASSKKKKSRWWKYYYCYQLLVYTDEVLKWDKSPKKNQQSLPVSGHVNCGCAGSLSFIEEE